MTHEVDIPQCSHIGVVHECFLETLGPRQVQKKNQITGGLQCFILMSLQSKTYLDENNERQRTSARSCLLGLCFREKKVSLLYLT